MRKSLITILLFAQIFGPFCPVVMAQTADADMMGMHHDSVKTEFYLQADHTSCLATATHDSNAVILPLLEWNGLVCPHTNVGSVLIDVFFETYFEPIAQEAPNILDHHCSHKRE